MMAQLATIIQLLTIASFLLATQAGAQDIGMAKLHHLRHTSAHQHILC